MNGTSNQVKHACDNQCGLPVGYVEHELHRASSALHPSLRRSLLHAYRMRVDRTPGLPRIGETILPWFSNMFSIDPETTRLIAPGWACIYMNCLLIDDQVDDPNSRSGVDPLITQYLSDEGMRHLCDAVQPDEAFWSSYRKYRLETWNAMTAEINTDYGVSDTSRYRVPLIQGRKAAMAKTCAAALLHKSYGVLLSARQEQAIDYICAAIQLLDDLRDYRDDHRAERANYLHMQCRRWFENNGCTLPYATLGVDQLLCGMIISGAVSNTWALASEMLLQAKQLLGSAGQARGFLFFTDMASACSIYYHRMQVAIAESDLQATYLGRAASLSEIEFHNSLSHQTIRRKWESLISIHSSGPKASN